jgi:hypothetical protein
MYEISNSRSFAGLSREIDFRLQNDTKPDDLGLGTGMLLSRLDSNSLISVHLR